MAEPLIPDEGLVRRAEAIIAEYARSRVEIIAARPGNPLRAETRAYGEAVALRAPPFGEHFFNRALGFTDTELAAAREVIAWYAEDDVPGMFEILPGPPSGALMALLAEHGYRQVGFHATFAGPAELPQRASAGVEVRRVEAEADLAAFSDAYHLGWDNQGRVPMAPWLKAPGWRLYLGLATANRPARRCSTSGGAWATSPTAPSTPAGAAAASTARCSTPAAPRRPPPGRARSSPAPNFSRPAPATCCARGSDSCSPRRSGARRRRRNANKRAQRTCEWSVRAVANRRHLGSSTAWQAHDESGVD